MGGGNANALVQVDQLSQRPAMHSVPVFQHGFKTMEYFGALPEPKPWWTKKSELEEYTAVEVYDFRVALAQQIKKRHPGPLEIWGQINKTVSGGARLATFR